MIMIGMRFTDVLSVLSGLAIFLYGMEVMGSGFKHMAGGKLQDFLEKLTKKPIIALLSGMIVTALVQSSGATTSMLVSFVNAGIMKVSQTVYVILGSNVGTTITGHLMALDVGLVAPFLAFIGVCLIMFVKHDKLNAIGEIMMGLGFIFIGMDMMSSGLKPLGSSPFFLKLLSNMQNPLFGILVGFVLTTIVQSSSASLGIIQSLAKSNLVGIKDVMFFNLGQNIGSCTTAMLASLSFNRDAKRVSIINFTFNICNAILFTTLYSFLPFDKWYEMIAPDSVVRQIAMMHTITNVITSTVLFPFAKALSKIAYLIIPDQGTEKKLQPEVKQAANIENNTAFNIFGINVEINNMLDLVETGIQKSLMAILEHHSVVEEVTETEREVNTINKGISRNLLLLMHSNTNMEESRQAVKLFSINMDLERMSDHALNIAQAGDAMVKEDLVFSVGTHDELHQLIETVTDSLHLINMIIETKDTSLLDKISENEDRLDELCYRYRNVEIERMQDTAENAKTGVLYAELLIDIERIGDHIMNVAESLCESDTDHNEII